jgi:hypothetical protein
MIYDLHLVLYHQRDLLSQYQRRIHNGRPGQRVTTSLSLIAEAAHGELSRLCHSPSSAKLSASLLNMDYNTVLIKAQLTGEDGVASSNHH